MVLITSLKISENLSKSLNNFVSTYRLSEIFIWEPPTPPTYNARQQLEKSCAVADLYVEYLGNTSDILSRGRHRIRDACPNVTLCTYDIDVCSLRDTSDLMSNVCVIP